MRRTTASGQSGYGAFLRGMIADAGALLRSFQANGGDEPRPIGLACDVAVNDFIIAAIRRAYPEDGIVSEEGRGSERPLREWTWIIDPIDGSTNFYRGLLSYTISVSVLHREDVVLGAVYEPYTDRMYFATRSGGAALNGRPIRVSPVADLRDSVLAISGYGTFRQAEAQDLFHQIVERVNVRISSSTALDLCYVAGGALEGRILARTHLWDYSAAGLIVEEAGGTVTDWAGDRVTQTTSQVLATNGRCHETLLALLRRGAKGLHTP